MLNGISAEKDVIFLKKEREGERRAVWWQVKGNEEHERSTAWLLTFIPLCVAHLSSLLRLKGSDADSSGGMSSGPSAPPSRLKLHLMFRN